MEDVAFSRSGNRIAFTRGASEPWIATAGAQGIVRGRRLADQSGASPAWSPGSRRVAFVSGEQVWVHGPAGDRPLTRGDDPAWSVSGDIAFSRAGGGISAIRPAGSDLRELTPRGSNPNWSPDGKRLVFQLGSDIAIVRADGSRLRVVTRGRAVDEDPVFSPDGRLVAFVRDDHALMTMTVRGQDLRTVVRVGKATNHTLSGPDWQPRPR